MYKSLDFSIDELFPVFAQDVSELYGLRASAMAGLPLDFLAAGWACFLTATLASAALCIPSFSLPHSQLHHQEVSVWLLSVSLTVVTFCPRAVWFLSLSPSDSVITLS